MLSEESEESEESSDDDQARRKGPEKRSDKNKPVKKGECVRIVMNTFAFTKCVRLTPSVCVNKIGFDHCYVAG